MSFTVPSAEPIAHCGPDLVPDAMLFLVAGLVTRVFGGVFGIGGGAILVPMLIYIFKMTQHQALVALQMILGLSDHVGL